jgi:uncharacterized membrane protein (DUF106 family)
MTTLNDLLRPIFDLLQLPLRGLPTVVGILIWSIPVGVFALWVFGKTSDQERIAAVKKRIFAALFEIRLFNDDLRAIMRAQWEILGHVLHYQALALKPMIFILPPLVLVMVQLHQFYGFRGLEPGDSVLLTVRLEPQSAPSDRRPQVSLELPPGLRAETDAVWVPALGELNWQLGVDAPGDYDFVVEVDETTYRKTVRATDRVDRLSPERPPRAFFDQLEWPSEKPLDRGGPVRSIAVAYPDRDVGIRGWHWSWRYAWMVVFFVLTMVVALVLRKPMGVEL